MRNLYNTFWVLVLLWGLSSCSDKQYQRLFERSTSSSDTSYHEKAVGLESYKIKPQDVLQIRNLQNLKFIEDETPTNSSTGNSSNTSGQGQTYQVEEDGTVALPYIGATAVAGLTRAEAQKLINEVYSKALLKSPIFELKIVNLKITLLGEVKTQGNFPLVKDRTTLTEVIGEAGGLTDKANERNIKIIRGTSKTPKVTEIDLNTLESVNDPRAILHNGDIIYVAENKRAARNDNLSSFSALIQPITLILNTIVIIFTISRVR